MQYQYYASSKVLAVSIIKQITNTNNTFIIHMSDEFNKKCKLTGKNIHLSCLNKKHLDTARK